MNHNLNNIKQKMYDIIFHNNSTSNVGVPPHEKMEAAKVYAELVKAEAMYKFVETFKNKSFHRRKFGDL